MGAGLATSTVGSYYSARTQKINLQGQAAIADTNARIAELGAKSATLAGQQQVGQLTMRAGQLKSSQRASMAANGIDLGVGNAGEVIGSTEIMTAIDKGTIERNALMQAWGYRTQGTNFQNDAIIRRASASGISPVGAAAGTLMTGAGSVATQWYALNKAGGLGGDVAAANSTNDPIYALGSSRGWWTK